MVGSLGRTPAEQQLLDAISQKSASGRGSPGLGRRGVAQGVPMSTQTSGPDARFLRAKSAGSENPYVYRQISLDEMHQDKDGKLSGGVSTGKRSGYGYVGHQGGPSSSSSSAAAVTSGGGIDSAAARLRDMQFSRKPLHIPYSEFEPYKADIHKRVEMSRACGLDGMLNIHIMSGQGLKSSKTSLRDLYCVVAVDSLNKARTMIRTGAINFDWDEAFDVDLEDSKEVSFLIYHWDPSYKHRLCFHGSVLLPGYASSGQRRYVAIKMEPKGILFVTVLYREPALSLQRLPSMRKNGVFGVDLETLIEREGTGLGVPLLVKKCVEEVESRGLDTVGIYRLCGSARRKIMLREAFEKNAAAVSLSPDNVSDIHVVTGRKVDFLLFLICSC